MVAGLKIGVVIRLATSGIRRWAACVAVIRRELSAQPAQIENGVEPAHQVIGRNAIFQANVVKQTVLPYQPITHHRPDPSPTASGPEDHGMNPGATGVLQHSQPTADIRLYL